MTDSILDKMAIGNVISLITGIIAAGLYGNIGISKFFYLLSMVDNFYNLDRACLYQHHRRLAKRSSPDDAPRSTYMDRYVRVMNHLSNLILH